MTTSNIFGTLNTARLGLMAQQAGINVTGQNVANVNTEGYTRRRVVLGSMPGPPLGGGGVNILGLKRYFDKFSTDRLVTEENLLGYASQRSEVLSQCSEMFNDLEGSGLGDVLDSFWGSIRQLESSPSDVTVREEVIARGDELADTFNRVSKEIESVRRSIDDILRASTVEINSKTEEVARLNDEISIDMTQGVDVSDLLDRRDQLVREVSKQVSISCFENDQRQINIFLEGGMPLVDGKNQSRLNVSQSAAPGAAPVEYVSTNGQVSDVTRMIKGGALGAAIEVRDTVVPGFIADLNQLAYDVATRFNAQHVVGYGLDGVNGRNFFTPLASVANAASLFQVDAGAASDPNVIAAAEDPSMLPGDNRNALDLAALADMDLAGGGTVTFNEAYASLVGNVGVETRRANDEVAMRTTSITHIEAIRDSSSGVSIDEEMTNLVQYQRAYQASTKVLSVVDEMLQTLLSMKG
ncbi:MAG: flagellar hook-associated protein FlgK [Deltaproteobacteria bacterium]|nr:flagellar hook-associated protein FlgK [Deltaproteobacteria bacterium]